MEVEKHKYYLTIIKKSLGVSYVAYEKENDIYYLVIKNNGKLLEKAKLEGTPQDVTEQKYIDVLNKLLYGEQIL